MALTKNLTQKSTKHKVECNRRRQSTDTVGLLCGPYRDKRLGSPLLRRRRPAAGAAARTWAAREVVEGSRRTPAQGIEAITEGQSPGMSRRCDAATLETSASP